ncbi:hypothetical protein L0Z13_15210 [Burkholderia multivorans]|uniref:hypothetical protein n=1 Tax=Burkholderia TaxID=32008 RepID=UPI0005610A79|nr:hypothetical protein [Burkholderia multivorans]AJY19928.1 hypothetical protein NP80_1006 [Burkholderia multivorans ATCC BAA-247]AVR21431.1 hypothetical protein A8H40_18490 [Burkholderia multivorans]MBY4791141.1 hypothetical protein [Burkholderia multivorans]MCO1434764.1 hypothetical protein [Burkholderia multivorans]PRD82564.1 hypothetical protein C6P74_03955 [Burkholderia multivorans]
MNDSQHHKDYPSLTIAQIRDLVALVRDSFGGNLPWTSFIERLLMSLEDIPGFEMSDVPPSLIDLAWAEYVGHRIES